MKQITEWMNEYGDGGEIQDTQDTAELTREEQERILKGVMQRIREEEPPVRAVRRRPGTRKLFTIIAAALAVAMGAGVYAVEKFSLGDSFAGWIGNPSQEQMEALGTSGDPLGISQTAGDVTITLQGVIGGKSTAYLLYDVELPEDKKFPENDLYYFGSERLVPEKAGSYGYHSELMSKEENILHFCLDISGKENLSGQQMLFTLETLKAVDENTEEVSVIAEGPWKFEFPMEYSDTSVKIPLENKISPWADRAITITEMSISPISIHLKCSRSLKATVGQEYQDSRLLNMGIRICFADGTFIDDNDSLTNGVGGKMLDIQVSRSYRKLIDLQQVTEIQITVEDNGETKVYSIPVSIK